SVRVDGAFDLVCRRGRTPEEPVGEARGEGGARPVDGHERAPCTSTCGSSCRATCTTSPEASTRRPGTAYGRPSGDAMGSPPRTAASLDTPGSRTRQVP